MDSTQECVVSKPIPENIEVRIIASREWKYSVWIGGGILGSLNSFEKRKLKEVRPALTRRCVHSE